MSPVAKRFVGTGGSAPGTSGSSPSARDPTTRRAMRGLVRWWADRPLRAKGLIVIAIPLAALIASAPLVFAQIRTAERLNDRVRVTLQVDRQIQTVLLSLLDAETGIRGYVASRRDVFLQPYFTGLARLPSQTSTLSALVAGDPKQIARSKDVERLSREELSHLAALRVLAERVDASRSLETQLLARGKTTMDDIRATLGAMRRTADRALAAQQVAANRAEHGTVLGVIIRTAIGLLAGLVAVVLFTSGIVRRTDRIRDNALRLAKEEPLLDPPEGRDEVGEAGIALDHAADLLTERRDALVAQRAELERSNTELEQFAYIASHDLQEPLRMVASYVQLLERDYKGKLGEEADEFIGFAVDGAKRMQALIQDLLTYSRVGRGAVPTERIELDAAFDRAFNNLHAAIEESGASVAADHLPTVVADESQMTQLLQNLIGNALKFHGDRPVEVRIGAERHNGEWTLGVRDNGIGIDPKHAERIFAIFQRLHTREEYPGTGIGLALCRKIVERHGGRIWVESAPGAGTTFRFTLPANEPRQERVEEEVA
jgi:signal transduction histidine kinase